MFDLSSKAGLKLTICERELLSGLVIDRYDHTAVLRLYAACWEPYLEEIVSGGVPPERFERRLELDERALRPARAHLVVESRVEARSGVRDALDVRVRLWGEGEG